MCCYMDCFKLRLVIVCNTCSNISVPRPQDGICFYDVHVLNRVPIRGHTNYTVSDVAYGIASVPCNKACLLLPFIGAMCLFECSIKAAFLNRTIGMNLLGGGTSCVHNDGDGVM